MHADAFVARWTRRTGGAERANYQMFLAELCDVVGVARPDVAEASAALNDYAFERAVRPRETDGPAAPKRIDLYKRGCFILEAKQSRLKGAAKALGVAETADEAPLGRRSAARGWDVMMQNARRQAENYVFLLDADHAAPPFLVVCDVGHCFELYADFTGTGRAYRHFPDRQGFRIYLEELRAPEARARLAALWTDPLSLDPAREAARVTRGVAKRLAEVSKTLEKSHPPEEVAHFLMRCIFTMFADDVGLLPKDGFKNLLEDCAQSPSSFAPLVDELWSKLDEKSAEKRYSTALRAHVPYFNGNLFHGARAFPLGAAEIRELSAAAQADWREVDPAIFGTLLEQALDKDERRRLGAHYTPRIYVQRLVDVTVMEPLRADWQAALTRAEAAAEAGDGRRAVAAVRDFHRKLCKTRVLDPACGTGNFLYVALELMKALEGEVLETLAKLGEPESMGLDGESVDPRQFLGLELNPRAAAIAELVVWIGYLQLHYRTRTGHPGEPILKAFSNVNFGSGGSYDAVLTWDGFPVTGVETRDGRRVETYPNARRPDWPEAEFIVGNPPFIGGKRLNAYLTPDYVAALQGLETTVPRSVDYVMYWWDRSARLVAEGKVVRAGLVATNSITQFYNSRLLAGLLEAKRSISIVWAIADHPWVDTERGARVRVALACIQAGRSDGVACRVVSETWTEDGATVALSATAGRINERLTTGETISAAKPLRANAALCWQGVKLVGDGFRLDAADVSRFARAAADEMEFVRPYLTGMQINRRHAAEWVIDFFGLDAVEARRAAPTLYNHVLEMVKPHRDGNRDEGFRTKWWLFGRPRPDLRDACAGLTRYIVTSEVSKSRFFLFVDDPACLPDGSLATIAHGEAWLLAVLSSSPHVIWSLWASGTLEDRPRYQNQLSFDPFPFPPLTADLRRRLAANGDELDLLRKAIIEENADLTLTAVYGTLDKIRRNFPLSPKDEDVKRRGLVLVLKELHDTIDGLVHEAYGWPAALSDEQILERLVALNAERAREEAAGHVRWLRPEFQAPRFGQGARKGADRPARAPEAPGPAAAARPAFPRDPYEHPLAVEAALAAAGRPLGPEDLARVFGGQARGRADRVGQALATLALYGRVAALPDGRFAALRPM